MNASLLAFGDMMNDVVNYFANFETATDGCRTVALWLAIALLIAFAVTKLVLWRTAPAEGTDARQKKANRIALFTLLGYAAAAIITFAACYFSDVAKGEESLVPITFYPLLVFAVAAVAGGFAVALKPVKAVKTAAVSVAGAALIAAIVCLIVYYSSGAAGEWNGVENDPGNSAAMYICAIALTAAIIGASFFADRTKGFDTRAITFGGVCIALSFALSYIRIIRMPMGGSITLASLLPLMLYSYMFGCKKGLVAGVVYGFLQAIQDAWILHPAQFVLDYVTAFMAIALTRYLSHFFSGVFAFGVSGADYAKEYGISALANPYFYSFVYQSLYIIPEMIIVIAVGTLLLSSGNLRREIMRYGEFEKPAVPQTQQAGSNA